MTNHSELLNLIAKKINAKIYIEIGVFNPDHNFNKIEVEEKIGVDPDPNAGATACMTSDNFFSFFKKIGGHADLVWIDGLHHADQVKKDIENAWEVLSPGGVIAIHDCNPHKESITHVPRDSREWCGDVYKVVSNITDSKKFTVDFDYGCFVLRKLSRRHDLFIMDREITWNDFDKNRQHYLHTLSIEEALEIISGWVVNDDNKPLTGGISATEMYDFSTE
jgi:SAM-dependent methyltransferase